MDSRTIIRMAMEEYHDDLDHAPGRVYRPEYTIGRMFSHLVVELAQHTGQVAYLRGLQRGLDG